MTRVRTLIVDDEPLARRGVRQLLAEFPEVTIVGEAGDGGAALRLLESLRPDLVFLDIEMPGFDGFDVIDLFGERRMPVIVFVTAHQDFAVRAFEVRALDYLVKPLSASRFHAVMERVRERIRLARPADRIAVTTERGERLIDPHEIDRIEADNYYATLICNGTRYRVRISLTELESKLDPARFIRVHRSLIVPAAEIRELREGQGGATVVLRDGSAFPVSRRRLGRVREQLGVR